MSKQLKEIQSILRSNATQETVKFMEKMVPGQQRVYGVKTPVLNEIVKNYKTGSFDLAEELWKLGSHEEKIIAIKIMEKTGKQDPDRLFKLFQKFSKEIDNWAICDGLGMQFLRTVLISHRDNIFEIAKKLNHSKDPWQRRLSLVMVEWYTRKQQMHPEIRELITNLKNDKEYYVQKAVKWIERNFEKKK